MSDPDRGGGAWTLLTGHGHVLETAGYLTRSRTRSLNRDSLSRQRLGVSRSNRQ
jgi:hypothetical protein